MKKMETSGLGYSVAVEEEKPDLQTDCSFCSGNMQIVFYACSYKQTAETQDPEISCS